MEGDKATLISGKKKALALQKLFLPLELMKTRQMPVRLSVLKWKRSNRLTKMGFSMEKKVNPGVSFIIQKDGKLLVEKRRLTKKP